jgi:hypothetical protein
MGRARNRSYLKTVLFLFLVFHVNAYADSNAPQLVTRPGENTGPITGLSLGDQETQQKIEILPPASGEPPMARIHGHFLHPEWSLISLSRILAHPSNTQTDFTLTVPLTGQYSSFQMVAIGPKGNVEKQNLAIFISDWPRFLRSMNAEKILPLTVGLGYSSISLKQTGVSDFSETALTLKVAYQVLLFPPHWDLGISTFFTALPISTNQSGINARFLGVNLRLGYKLPFVAEPWQVYLFAGGYYTTMFVTQDSFGYQNELGPQFYPTVRRYFKNGDGVSAYLKYSPVTSGSQAFTSTNREIAAGIAYLSRLKNQHLLSIALDWAQVKLDFPSLGADVQSQSVTLGLAYNL